MEYRVLARKYRPSTFDDLIGQEVLVRTLSNAIASGRIAHAFLLTGIRGVGKTTTARIIARALNCIGPDGKGGPTIRPCGVCANCTQIAEDRHVDVLEMDAASHTGVGDIRELIDTVRYLPGSARYKIYIIDEVHMLSTSAFNALLKTLEEPPAHVKFIFATTESRKIPVTILSRCQRFDLKRVEAEALAAHLANICAKEQVEAEPEALKLIAIAAEGSVRDSLSLLDQAIARAADQKSIAAESVRQMMGAGDNSAVYALLETLLSADMARALELAQRAYHAGSDPLVMLQELMDTVHLITRAKVAPAALDDVSLSQFQRENAQRLAQALSMPVLARLWQMLLKGLQEVRMAPMPMAAFEMLMVRIAYAAQLPTPAEVIRSANSSPSRGEAGREAHSGESAQASPHPNPPPNGEGIKPNLAIVKASPRSFEEVVALFGQNREALLFTQMREQVSVSQFADGKIELFMDASLPRDFGARVAQCLEQWTGQPWQVLRTHEKTSPTLHEQEEAQKQQRISEAAATPLVSSVLEQFPGAKITTVK